MASAHESHCNQGEWLGMCKYGYDYDCPVMRPILDILANTPLHVLTTDLIAWYSSEVKMSARDRVTVEWLRHCQPKETSR